MKVLSHSKLNSPRRFFEVKHNPPILALHGGAGDWTKRDAEGAIKSIRQALEVGFSEFHRGSAVEAVVESIAVMEDSGFFDAGKGSVRNAMGEIEMDAGLMVGNELKVGAVAVARVKNPIRKALEVMKQGKHVLIAGLKEEWSHGGNTVSGDTVGAVALDDLGNLVAGTSTGGIEGKAPGRIGDSPIPGAGYYATKRIAASCTGIGEIILKVLPAKEVDMLVSMGFPLRIALKAVAEKITGMFGEGNFGIIAVDSSGHVGWSFNTRGMARGVISKGVGPWVSVFEGDIP